MNEQETRRTTPHVCVTDGKHHIRKFLREALSDFGCTILECAEAHDLGAALDAKQPDLVVLGLTAGGISASEMLTTLADKDFSGKILPVVPRGSTVIEDVQEIAERLGVALLPPLLTPFNSERLRDSVAVLLPKASSEPFVDISEALRAGWLELWYQPKIDARSIVMRGAEALLRVRHPLWGIVPTAYFMADDGNPRSRPVSEAVISRAVDDWHYFFFERGPIELAINLPIAFLQDPESISCLRQKLPDHAGFDGLIIESNGTDIVRNMELAQDIARQLRLNKIAFSIDDLGAEWLSFSGLRDFPFVEIKVDRKFVTGCANDRLKQSVCHRILDLANSYGARTVAEGVETWADFIAVREMGFDLVQGFLFAKPMSAEKFAQTCWATSPAYTPAARPSSVGAPGIADDTRQFVWAL